MNMSFTLMICHKQGKGFYFQKHRQAANVVRIFSDSWLLHPVFVFEYRNYPDRTYDWAGQEAPCVYDMNYRVLTCDWWSISCYTLLTPTFLTWNTIKMETTFMVTFYKRWWLTMQSTCEPAVLFKEWLWMSFMNENYLQVINASGKYCKKESCSSTLPQYGGPENLLLTAWNRCYCNGNTF